LSKELEQITNEIDSPKNLKKLILSNAVIDDVIVQTAQRRDQSSSPLKVTIPDLSMIDSQT
jgi:alcohol dehydrogenase class IV